MKRSKVIEEPFLLLVEGPDDRLFFHHLLQDALKIDTVQVMDVAGRDKLRKRLRAVSMTRGFSDVRALGLVRDADESSSSAFQSMQDALKAVGVPVPDKAFSVARHADASMATAVLIMPGQPAGRGLEKLCLASVSDDPAMPCVDAFFECLRDQSRMRWKNAALEEKARLQAFLATRDKPGLRLGEAAARGVWPWNDPAFDRVRETLKRLFRVDA